MSLDVIHRYEKNIDAAAADFDAIHAETNQLQKMSLSDPQEQNKRNLVGSGSNQFQTRPPGATSCVDDDFARLISTEEAKESMKRQREWHALHTCTRCGLFDHRCQCKVRALRWGHRKGPYEFKKIPGKNGIYDGDALPPWRAKQRQKVLDEMKDSEFSLLVICQIK